MSQRDSTLDGAITTAKAEVNGQANGHRAAAKLNSAEEDNVIRVRGARQHNLKDVDLEIPRNQL
ncbi:MAG: hypothetical protein AAF728_03205, partial [Cyanobacteria bacterium P01_D01_bin.128]